MILSINRDLISTVNQRPVSKTVDGQRLLEIWKKF